MRRGMKNSGGFTLVELLIVVAIIGILAAILLPKVAQAIETAKQGRTVARLDLIRGGANMYFADHGVTAHDEMNYYPYEMIQLFHHDENGGLQGCTLHTPPHYYLENLRDYAEEVGDGPMPGYQITSWCTSDHSYHINRQVEAGASKGGWNWCIPNGAGSPTGPASGTVWIDEDCMMFSGKTANQM